MGQGSSDRSSAANLQMETNSYNTGGPTTTDQPQDDGVSKWCKILARTVCVLAGIDALITGMFAMITFTPLCLVAGILLMLMGFLVILLEAPCCCQCMNFIQPISKFSERRTYWQKALAYSLSPLIIPILCFGMSTMIASALLITSGVIYGLIALGKRRAGKQPMATQAGGRDVEMNSTLVTK